MEADRRLVREPARERAEPTEGARGRVLVELPDGGGDLRLRVRRSASRGPVEDLAPPTRGRPTRCSPTP